MHARKPSLPLRRVVFEAVVLAGFVERHWEPRRKGRATLPGLRAAAGAAGLGRDVARELRDLARAVELLDAELKATKVRVAALARSLREPRRNHAADDARRITLRRRDALATLLMERMRSVRAAVRCVFQEHPKLARKATSDYERKRWRKNAEERASREAGRRSEPARRGVLPRS